MDFAQAKITNINNFPVEESTDDNYNGLDICFVLDATGSMQCFINSVKELINQLADETSEKIKELQADPESIRFAVIAYEDHYLENINLENVVKFVDFTDKSSAMNFTSKLYATGGADSAEAVIDGLAVAANKLSWRKETEKILYLIADAPPHGKKFGCSSDNFKNGCPCNLSEDKILPKLRKMNVSFNIVMLKSELKLMVSIYSKLINIECIDLSVDVPSLSIFLSSSMPKSKRTTTGEDKFLYKSAVSATKTESKAIRNKTKDKISASSFGSSAPLNSQAKLMNKNISIQVQAKMSKYKKI